MTEAQTRAGLKYAATKPAAKLRASAKYRQKNKYTFNHVSLQMFTDQNQNSKKRGHKPPTYTLDELRTWIKAQPDTEALFIMWKVSGYNEYLKPSIDRIDNNISYEFDNLQMMTWRENNLKR